MTPRTLVRLYPRAWRERYQDEMLAMLGDAPMTMAQAADLARLGFSEWCRRPVVGPTIVAAIASVLAQIIGGALNAAPIEPPGGVVTGIAWLLGTYGLGYLLWRSNEWLFERSPTTGQRQVRIGLALAIGAGIISVWGRSAAAHGALRSLWFVGNPAFFWAWIVWSARVQSLRRERDQDVTL